MNAGRSSMSAPFVTPRATSLVVEELSLGLPLDRYREAFSARANTFVLDGNSVERRQSRPSHAPDASPRPLTQFSFLGAEPFLTFRAFRTDERSGGGGRRARVVLATAAGTTSLVVDEPFTVLRELLATYALETPERQVCPLPLRAGAVGYIGYEVGQMLERLPSSSRPSQGMPDIALGFHDWIVGRCRRSGRCWLSVVGRGDDEDGASRAATLLRDEVVGRLTRFERTTPTSARSLSPEPPSARARSAEHTSPIVRPHVARDAYLAKIARAKEHIAVGDAFEICLTHPFDAPFPYDPWELWRVLRRDNPAPFAAFLDLPEGAVVSSSPERFVRLDAAGVVESRPIKGTRPRGETPDEDARLAAELASSPKDRAENAMIVDLVRNDLGHICRFGSVDVPSLFAVEPHATVHQLVSTIRGELDDGKDAVDVLEACFPPGSMTGAPKIEAMTILENLEEVERGVYSGGLGWIDFRGTMDMSVVIRTVVVRDERARLHVGGAIVADSEPIAEHEETLDKARALIEAIERVHAAYASDGTPHELRGEEHEAGTGASP